MYLGGTRRWVSLHHGVEYKEPQVAAVTLKPLLTIESPVAQVVRASVVVSSLIYSLLRKQENLFCQS